MGVESANSQNSGAVKPADKHEKVDDSPLHPRWRRQAPSDAFIRVAKAAVRAAVLGYSLRSGISILLRLVSVVRGKARFLESLLKILRSDESVRFGALFGIFVFLWKGTDDIMRRVLGPSHPACGFVAGGVAGLALFAENPKRRLSIAQQLLVRGVECGANYLAERRGFKLPHADALIFILSSAQIMYAYVMRPSTLPRSYYKFIVNTGPVHENVLGLVRDSLSGTAMETERVVGIMEKLKATPSTMEIAKHMGTHPDMLSCKIIHPARDNCEYNSLLVFRRGFMKGLPVYLSLNFVPMLLLKLPQFLKRPVELSTRSLLNAARSASFLGAFTFFFQTAVCNYKRVLSKDSKYYYWLCGIAAGLAIFIEEPRRRLELALYVLPRGVDSLYRVLYNRRRIVYVKHFDVAMFCAAMSLIIGFLQTEPQRVTSVLRSLLRRGNLVVENGFWSELKRSLSSPALSKKGKELPKDAEGEENGNVAVKKS